MLLERKFEDAAPGELLRNSVKNLVRMYAICTAIDGDKMQNSALITLTSLLRNIVCVSETNFIQTKIIYKSYQYLLSSCQLLKMTLLRTPV